MFAFRTSTSSLLRRSITGLRFNSTAASSNGAANTTSLTWNQFLNLRKVERRYNLFSSVFTTAIGAGIGLYYISQIEMDPTTLTIFGFDPILVTAVTLVATGGLGYLAGPSIGSRVFKLTNKKNLSVYELKNSVFLKHIIKNRVDASRQSFSNPVPDFYGEKIFSLKDYKQWLRDCNAYRRKAVDFL